MSNDIKRIIIEPVDGGSMVEMVKLQVEFAGGKTVSQAVSEHRTWVRGLFLHVENARRTFSDKPSDTIGWENGQ